MKFFCHVNELLENENKICPPLLEFTVLFLCGQLLVWLELHCGAGLCLNGVNLSHRSLGGMLGSSSIKCRNKTWHFCSVFCISECYKAFHRALNYIPIMECLCRRTQSLCSIKDMQLGMFMEVLDSI